MRGIKKTMLLICEGTKTEPNFFAALREDRFRCHFEGEIEIRPKPLLEKDDIETNTARGSIIRPIRRMKNLAPVVTRQDFFPGPQPLNWVQFGVECLDTYDEVWCVFDKDDHPKRAEAFALAEEEQRKGSALFIAFSSRCIEYYFILHKELLYHSFEKSECNEKVNGKTKSFHCMLPNAVLGKACDGTKCVNGYARMKGYWQESKSDESMYPILKPHLLYAIRNAELIRRMSDKNDPNTPFYDRNPYVNIDFLMAKLLGFIIIPKGGSISSTIGGTVLSLEYTENNEIISTNNGEIAFSTGQITIEKLDPFTETVLYSVQGANILYPNDSEVIGLNGIEGDLFIIRLSSFNYLLVL